MSELVLPAQPIDLASYAMASFLARYPGGTLRAYRLDLKAFLTWCLERDLPVLQVQRPHLELYLRSMETHGYAAATISRRFGTVAGFYRCAVLDGHLSHDPSAGRRPAPRHLGNQRRTVLHPLEYAALLTAARHDGNASHALVALLGMLGLRVSEACGCDITDLSYSSGWRALTRRRSRGRAARAPCGGSSQQLLRGP